MNRIIGVDSQLFELTRFPEAFKKIGFIGSRSGKRIDKSEFSAGRCLACNNTYRMPFTNELAGE